MRSSTVEIRLSSLSSEGPADVGADADPDDEGCEDDMVLFESKRGVV